MGTTFRAAYVVYTSLFLYSRPAIREIAQNDGLMERLSSFFGFRELRNFWICSKKFYENKKLFKKQLRNLIRKVFKIMNLKLTP